VRIPPIKLPRPQIEQSEDVGKSENNAIAMTYEINTYINSAACFFALAMLVLPHNNKNHCSKSGGSRWGMTVIETVMVQAARIHEL
jgi:hypothetical protein